MLIYLIETKILNSHRKLTLRYYEDAWELLLTDNDKEELKYTFRNEKDAKESFEYMYDYEMKLFNSRKGKC